MVMLGTIKSSEIRNNRDSKKLVRIVSSEITGPDDIQSIELMTPMGEDFNPEAEDVVLIFRISEAYKMGLLIDDQVAPDFTILKGEKEFYSKLGSTKRAKLKLNLNSEVVFNDGINSAVQFEALKTKFDSLQAELRAHIHPGVTVGAGSTAASTTLFDADISAAEVEKVKL